MGGGGVKPSDSHVYVEMDQLFRLLIGEGTVAVEKQKR
jgi:hypothetical protein